MILTAMSIALLVVLTKFFIGLFTGVLGLFGIILRLAVIFVMAAIVIGMIKTIF